MSCANTFSPKILYWRCSLPRWGKKRCGKLSFVTFPCFYSLKNVLVGEYSYLPLLVVYGKGGKKRIPSKNSLQKSSYSYSYYHLPKKRGKGQERQIYSPKRRKRKKVAFLPRPFPPMSQPEEKKGTLIYTIARRWKYGKVFFLKKHIWSKQVCSKTAANMTPKK